MAAVSVSARTRSPPKLSLNESDSVKGGIKKVEELIEVGMITLREYKKEIEMLRQEIGLMENHLTTQNDENVKVVNPYIISNFEDLTVSIER